MMGVLVVESNRKSKAGAKVDCRYRIWVEDDLEVIWRSVLLGLGG
jgi:hypothetical protein